MSVPGRWDPLKELKTVQSRMNRLFETALARTDFETADDGTSWTPVSDVYETPTAVMLCLELPGFEQDKIDLRIEGDELIVSGEREIDTSTPNERFHRVERSYGRFSRRFRVPSTVRRDAVEANYQDGLLRVTLPLRDGGPARSVQVEIGR